MSAVRYEPPEWLTEEARDEWQRLEPGLRTAGIITELDLATFAQYCTRLAAARKAQRYADDAKTPKAWAYWEGFARKSWDAMSKAAQQLGVTPAAREKVGRVEAPKQDPLDKYLPKRRA